MRIPLTWQIRGKSPAADFSQLRLTTLVPARLLTIWWLMSRNSRFGM